MKGTTHRALHFWTALRCTFRPAFTDDGFASWPSTCGYLQQVGYYFKDALYLIDDFKPELVRRDEAVRLIQAYADNAARGRLIAGGARPNDVRPIRGQLVSTGEEIPEQSASALARMIVVDVPDRAKDLERGRRCLERCRDYAAVTADFIRHLLAEGRTQAFVARVPELQQLYLRAIAGRPNDLRVASNFALLGAGFEEIARYLADVWPEAAAETRRYLDEDLPALRDGMLRGLQAREPAFHFLAVLRELVSTGRVRLLGLTAGEAGLIVGQQAANGLVRISTRLALQEVEAELRRRRQRPLGRNERSLLEDLSRAGLLRDHGGNPLVGNQPRTRYVRLGGTTLHCFYLAAEVLLGDAPA